MEIPGFTPSRRLEKKDNGVMVYVKPPASVFPEAAEVSVFLTKDQFSRYAKWRSGVMLVQEALPDLSDSEREKLMTGLTDQDFKRIAGDDDV